MSEKRVDTIIVGGGVAGLACARRLHDNKKNFLLISKDVGGRITSSKDGKINYGAFFITEEYKHIKKWVCKGERISLMDLNFHIKNRRYHLFTIYLLLHILTTIRFIFHLYRFRKEYRKFKKDSEIMSQKEALDKNQYLLKLYKQTTKNYLKQHGFEPLIDKYTEEFIKDILYAMSFVSDKNASAFAFMQWSSQLLLSPLHEFTFKNDAIIDGIKNKISIDEVIKIQRKNDNYIVKTKSNQYSAKNIVVATEPWVAKKLLHLKKINEPIHSYLFHIRGKIKEPWDGKENLFNPKIKLCVISHQIDGTYLAYSRTRDINWKKYFKNHKIIFKKTWSPAFVFPSSLILDSNRGKNLYMIGDHNVGGMEDTFITGIYAANKIISNS